jgi:Uma2 family endonuclease
MSVTLERPRRKLVHVGPEDDGRRMSLDDFAEAVAAEGYLYELGQGVIEVSGIPNLTHGNQVQVVRRQLAAYEDGVPDVIGFVGTGSEAKVLIGPAESERHPDLSVYLGKQPADTRDLWSTWVPAIVVEVVSDRSAKRDYDIKPAEYLAFGVTEYWILDAGKNQLTVMTRWRGQWQTKVIKPPAKHKTPLLPGFALDLKRVFAPVR